MEVDGPSWIYDVEKAGEKNAVNIARLYERVDQVQDDVLESRKESKIRSDERLEAIMGRFDRLDSISSKRVGVALSFLIACSTAIWFAVVQPLHERVAILERRLIDAEHTIAVLSTDDNRV